MALWSVNILDTLDSITGSSVKELFQQAQLNGIGKEISQLATRQKVSKVAVFKFSYTFTSHITKMHCKTNSKWELNKNSPDRICNLHTGLPLYLSFITDKFCC